MYNVGKRWGLSVVLDAFRVREVHYASYAKRSTMNDSGAEANRLDVPMNVIPLTTLEILYRLVVGSVGVLINSAIITIVSVSRQLHYPRHIYWAGISIAYFTYIIQLFNDVLGNYYKSKIACQLYVLHATVPYTVISLYLMITALDRLLAITRYEWYKRRVTNKRVILLLINVYLITLAGITSPFWTGFQQVVKCTVNMTHMHYVMTVNVTTAIVCICLHVKIFLLSRAVIQKYPRQPTIVKFTNNKVTSVLSQGKKLENRPKNMDAYNAFVLGTHSMGMTEALGVHASPVNNGSDTIECHHFWQTIFERTPRNLEAKAALSLSIYVLPMWLCHFPQAFFTFALFWCLNFEKECISILKINAVVKNFYFAYTFYNPLMYVVTSKEFHRAVVRLCKRKRKMSPIDFSR